MTIINTLMMETVRISETSVYSIIIITPHFYDSDQFPPLHGVTPTRTLT
jgi:hypothetical protein